MKPYDVAIPLVPPANGCGHERAIEPGDAAASPSSAFLVCNDKSGTRICRGGKSTLVEAMALPHVQLSPELERVDSNAPASPASRGVGDTAIGTLMTPVEWAAFQRNNAPARALEVKAVRRRKTLEDTLRASANALAPGVMRFTPTPIMPAPPSTNDAERALEGSF